MIHVCFCTDNNYACHLGVAIASALMNADADDQLFFHILDNGISMENRQRLLMLRKIKDFAIEFVNVEEEIFEKYDFGKKANFAVPAALYRFKIPEIFKQYDRILWLDCDVVVLSSLAKLYETDFDGKALAMVKDYLDYVFVGDYFNSGVILFNVKECNAMNLPERLIARIMTKKTEFLDQDAINEVARGMIAELPFSCNAQIHRDLSANVRKIKDMIGQAIVLHYTGRSKPWSKYVTPFDGYYYRYLRYTALPWRLKAELIRSKRFFLNMFYRVERLDDVRTHYLFGLPVRRTFYDDKEKKLYSRVLGITFGGHKKTTKTNRKNG